MKARNEELNNRIRELQLHIDQERDDGKRRKCFDFRLKNLFFFSSPRRSFNTKTCSRN
jgi:hypothetical protein